MSELLQQAVMAIKTGAVQRAGQLLSQILQADPGNTTALVWLSQIAGSEEKRRACLERALALNSDHPEVRQAWLDWVLAEASAPAAPTEPPPAIAKTPVFNSSQLIPPVAGIAGASLQEFLLQLTKNYNLLKEREAKYGSTAAPLDLLNQIEDYERAIALTEAAIERAAPLEELQAEFGSLNLQISTVVFVAQEPPRKPFKGLNPYRGLLKFTEDDAQFFFGRTAAIQSLLNTVQYLVETETSQQLPDLIAVLGPSGSGKSSLVRAGLIPALWAGRIEGSQQWPLKVMLPGVHPLDALAQVFEGKVGQELAAIRASLNGGEKALHELIVESLALARLPDTAVFVLVIDQFEETFTLGEDEPECRTFIDQILYATQTRRNRAFIILTMRSDFYSKVTTYKPLAEVITLNQMLVSPMTEKELREAILLPAEAVGLELEKALVESLLRDTANAPGVLPLLQHALLELFHRRQGNLLTLAAYNEIGGVKGALAHRANSVINELTPAQQTIARRIFIRLVRPGEGAADTRRRAGMTEVLSQDTHPQEVETVVKTLADANLIITDQHPETGEIVLDVVHEALITEWPLLRHWLDENRQSLRLQQELAEATRDWQARSRSEDYLYQGARLLEVEEWSAVHPGELNPTEVAFIEASAALRDREQTEQEAQRQRELEQAQALGEEQRRRAEEQARAAASLRQRAVWIMAMGVVAILLALAAVWQLFIAQRERASATSRELAANAQVNLPVDPELSALLALQAVSTADTQQAWAVLRETVQDLNLQMTLSGHEDWVSSVVFSPDGARLATASLDKTTKVWDVASGQELLTLMGHKDTVRAVAFSPDGARLATASRDKTAKVWDAVSGRELLTLSGHKDAVRAVAFSPDGTHLATASGDKTAKVWDATSGRELLTLSGHEDLINAIAFSPNGAYLATAGSDKTAKMWDAASGQELLTLTGHKDYVSAVAFSPDGKRLATASADGTVKVWNVTSGQELLTLSTQDALLGVAFSPDGTRLATASADKTAKLWDAASGQELQTFSSHKDVVRSVAFSPDGTRLVTASDDRTAKIWNVINADILSGHTDLVWRVAFSPDGTRVATAANDGTARVWDVASGRELLTLAGQQNFVSFVAFSPDGTRLATADKTAKVWDATSGQELLAPSGHEGLYSVTFSPDGTQLATAGFDGKAKIWDAASGRELLTLSGHKAALRLASFSPDGTRLATASEDKTAKVWDTASGQELLTLADHKDIVTSVAFSPDGKRLATSSLDGTAKVWDAVSGQELLTLAGHGGPVNYVVFSRDGAYIATASSDQTAKIWDAVSGAELMTLLGHTHAVWGVAFNPQGTRVATAGQDRTVRVYILDRIELTRTTQSRLSRWWTPEECQQYLYQDECPSKP